MNHRGTYTDRYRRLTEQAAYQRRIERYGLPSLLAPYTIRSPRMPQQRRAVPTNPAIYAV